MKQKVILQFQFESQDTGDVSRGYAVFTYEKEVDIDKDIIHSKVSLAYYEHVFKRWYYDILQDYTIYHLRLSQLYRREESKKIEAKLLKQGFQKKGVHNESFNS